MPLRRRTCIALSRRGGVGRALLAVAVVSWLVALPSRAWAEYRDDVGFTRLQAELGAAMPTGSGVTVTQTEALQNGNARPDPANAELAGKTITPYAATGGVSSHATTVAAYYFGRASSLAPGIQTIDVFEAGNWLGWGCLRRTSSLEPLPETRAVQNHSWIGTLDQGGMDDVQVLRRLDFAIGRDDFLAVVGLNNGSGSVVPSLLGNLYNGVSVGLTNGDHSSGTSTTDGTGRVKPEIVAPFAATSWATPSVGAAAALLIEKARSTVALADGERSVVLKALLLAGATKAEFPGWARTGTRPLDAHYGAGQLNVFRSYHILAAGRQGASGSTTRQARGWDFAQTSGARRYFFEIAPGNIVPGFSALLTWNRSVDPVWPNPTASLANLSLKLYAASGFTTGALIDSSDSNLDNLEHLYVPNLPPGRYALEVAGNTAGVSYGLAWYSQSTVTLAATAPTASEQGLTPGGLVVTRSGDFTDALTVRYGVGGTAANGADYAALSGSVTIPAGAASAPIAIAPLADSAAEDDEVATLTLASDFAYSVGAGASATVTIRDLPIDAWRSKQFSAAELANPAIAGDLADPEGDGLVNRLEYALGLLPRVAQSAPPPFTTTKTSDSLTLTYTRPLGVTDIAYIVETSPDLVTWHSGAGYTASAPPVTNGATETVSVTSAPASGTPPRLYIRLRVERQ